MFIFIELVHKKANINYFTCGPRKRGTTGQDGLIMKLVVKRLTIGEIGKSV